MAPKFSAIVFISATLDVTKIRNLQYSVVVLFPSNNLKKVLREFCLEMVISAFYYKILSSKILRLKYILEKQYSYS